ncbi:hypothetical protein CDEST_15231 [Colletotrichum destructivum]|uniref:Uncharacterized protein n=1 Tax=Colletotrichum destructivum TaxID=34406 RepID=A0AAX4J3U7_9PEZI|nr:hypothetical protein CDEST_15231 [Colletotrichum destructivum]
MSKKLHDAVTEARTLWQCNYMRNDARWSLKQLHGLYHLILDNRDELAKHASSVLLLTSSTSCHTEYSTCANEKNIARLVGELSLHIQDADQTIVRSTWTASAPLLGQLEVLRQPLGVSVVVFGPQTPVG